MKKVLLYAVTLCLTVGVITGCSGAETATEYMTDEYITDRFYEAYDFWSDWVYGQNYVTDRMSSSQNMYYGAVDDESPIQSKSELKTAMESHFTKSLANEFMIFLNPENIDGKLYIAYGDVGDNGEVLDNVTVKKVNDNKYELILDMTQFFEERKYTKKVYYVLEDGKWVFENDDMDKYFFHWQKHENIEYLPVMKKYYLAMAEEWDVKKIEKYNLHDILTPFYENEPLKSIGYSFMDINGDNQNELMIGKVNSTKSSTKYNHDKIIWDMYTVKNGEPYRLFTSLERNRYYVLEDEGKYMVANERHGSATDYEYTYFDFDGEKLNTEKSIICVGDNLPDNPWFMDGEPVDEKEAMRIRDGYWEKYISIEFIPFDTLG